MKFVEILQAAVLAHLEYNDLDGTESHGQVYSAGIHTGLEFALRHPTEAARLRDGLPDLFKSEGVKSADLLAWMLAEAEEFYDAEAYKQKEG